MQVATKPFQRNTSNTAAASSRCSIERLEGRTLLSAEWSTVDSLPLAPGALSYAEVDDMAADSAGGVYAVGQTYDGSIPLSTAVVRFKSGGSSEWQTVATLQGTPGSGSSRFNDVAVSPTGKVYLSGTLSGTYKVWKGTWNAGHTALSLSVVDTPSLGQFTPPLSDIAVDAAGNVFEAGWYTANNSAGTLHWFVRKQTGGQGSFKTVDDFVYNNSHTRAQGLTVVPSGPNAGVYVVGFGGGDKSFGASLGAHWIVRKSTNGGSTWTTKDSFQLEPSTDSPSRAREITADDTGTLHVIGTVSTRQQTGGTPTNPTYTYSQRWYMRNSSNGGSTWTSDDIYPESAAPFSVGLNYLGGFDPQAVATDQAAKVYVAGIADYGSVNSRSIVRTNADGGWSTSDDYQAPGGGYTRGYSMTRDSSGAVYVGGQDARGWSVRSTAPAAAALFSSVPITGANNEGKLATQNALSLVDELLGSPA